MYKGSIISESLKEPSFINKLKVYRVKIGEEDEEIPRENRIGRWHLYWVEVSEDEIKEISKELKEGWYAHFWQNKKVIVIFKDKRFKIDFDNKETWKEVLEYGKSLGIPEEQLDFPIEE